MGWGLGLLDAFGAGLKGAVMKWLDLDIESWRTTWCGLGDNCGEEEEEEIHQNSKALSDRISVTNTRLPFSPPPDPLSISI
ncbi:hypothetical protein H0H93_012605 [Arthromyces matolae]|nr:hypothetical protein H0H93_012605 [Arthromyces matolae]